MPGSFVSAGLAALVTHTSHGVERLLAFCFPEVVPSGALFVLGELLMVRQIPGKQPGLGFPIEAFGWQIPIWRAPIWMI